MDIDWLWKLILAFIGGVGASFGYTFIQARSLWSALNHHKEKTKQDLDEHKSEDTKFHLDIVQNIVPNAMKDLRSYMDSRFDRLEDKLDHKTRK